MPNIYLLRHGQTAWNKDRIFRGRYDIPLDSHGLAQADCVRQALEKVRLAKIYSSGLSRAVQTAEPVAAGRGLAVAQVPELLDIDYGQWTGKSQKEIEKLYPELNRQWLGSPEKVRFPGGEDLADVRKRAFGQLVELANDTNEGQILIVSHRVVLKVLICAALDMPLSRFWQVQLDTASLSVLIFEKDIFTVRLINDTCHLAGLGPAEESVDF